MSPRLWRRRRKLGRPFGRKERRGGYVLAGECSNGKKRNPREARHRKGISSPPESLRLLCNSPGQNIETRESPKRVRGEVRDRGETGGGEKGYSRSRNHRTSKGGQDSHGRTRTGLETERSPKSAIRKSNFLSRESHRWGGQEWPAILGGIATRSVRGKNRGG